MATQPLPPREPDSSHKKADATRSAGISRKQPLFEVVRSVFKKPSPQKPLQAIIKKPWLRVAGIAVAVPLLLLLALPLPLLINVNSFRPKIESEASSALGRRVTIGNLSLSILSGSVGAEDITIADDSAFSKSPFVTAKSLKVGVELMPLIFSKQINVTHITLEAPQIALLKTTRGKGIFRASVQLPNKRHQTLPNPAEPPPQTSQ